MALRRFGRRFAPIAALALTLAAGAVTPQAWGQAASQPEKTVEVVVPTGAGGYGAFSPLSAVAPKLVRSLYDACRRDQFIEARQVQENIGLLHHAIKKAGASGLNDGLAGIKTALAHMGRECVAPRPPVRSLGEVERGKLIETLAGMAFLRAEPRGW